MSNNSTSAACLAVGGPPPRWTPGQARSVRRAWSQTWERRQRRSNSGLLVGKERVQLHRRSRWPSPLWTEAIHSSSVPPLVPPHSSSYSPKPPWAAAICSWLRNWRRRTSRNH